MSLLNELHSLMVKYRFRPNRRLGQHFMINEAVLEKMAELAGLQSNDVVLEIGAGTGFLTRLLQRKCKVAAVEIDEKLCTLLEQEMRKENLQLLCGDFLKVRLPPFNKVVALPSYSNSAAIMYKLFEHEFESAVLVFQREFAEKLVALPGFMEYNALSVLIQYGFEVSIVQKVEPGNFFPKPEGESCIVKMVKTEAYGKVRDKKAFAFFVKSVFRFKNKNLRNALLKSYQFIKEDLNLRENEFRERVEKLHMHDVKLNLISVREFVQIFNFLTGTSAK